MKGLRFIVAIQWTYKGKTMPTYAVSLSSVPGEWSLRYLIHQHTRLDMTHVKVHGVTWVDGQEFSDAFNAAVVDFARKDFE